MTTASTAECGGWYMSAAAMTAELYCAGRWGGMCLCPVHFLLSVVPVVPGSGAAYRGMQLKGKKKGIGKIRS